MSTVEQIFELPLHGVNLPAFTIDVPELRLTAQLQAGAPLRLKIRVTGVPEHEAVARANKIAQTLYRRSLLRFGCYIERSEPPRAIQRTHAPCYGRNWWETIVGKATGKAFVGASITVT